MSDSDVATTKLHTYWALRQFYEWHSLCQRQQLRIRALESALRAERENHNLARVMYGHVR